MDGDVVTGPTPHSRVGSKTGGAGVVRSFDKARSRGTLFFFGLFYLRCALEGRDTDSAPMFKTNGYLAIVHVRVCE